MGTCCWKQQQILAQLSNIVLLNLSYLSFATLCLKCSIGFCKKVYCSMTAAAQAELDQTDCTEGTLNNILFIGKWRRLCGWGWFIRELLGDCGHHWASGKCLFFFFFLLTLTAQYLLQSLCFIPYKYARHSSITAQTEGWNRQDISTEVCQNTWDINRSHTSPCHVDNLLHLGAPLQYALILVNERGSGGGSHCRDHWSSLSENLYSI